MMEFQWEQRGGRVKLVEIDGVVSVGKDISVEHLLTTLKSQEAQEFERKHQERCALEWMKTQKFLERHKFDSADVNAPRVSWWGLQRTYPLHKAVMVRNWEMIDLLMKFGANPRQKYSHGRVPADYFNGHVH
ncbi:unnamed protein product [Cladocopium goreaui]|uniref:Uncharacterized protein n=1 Tax=Cladocopium goreaui TaxID=2562237 RepID=A0A9P1C2A9_9DINO|nr:unnamed protein product [Cladocopium goreaui]